MSNRKAAEDYIIKSVESLLPGGGNGQIYRDLFDSMDDKAFKDFMKGLEDGSSILALVAPNLGKVSISVERNLAIAEKVGVKFFERIYLKDELTGLRYLSNPEYLIVDLPLCRQVQLQTKKVSIPEHNRTVDQLTGQPTGDSKGSKISYNELQVLAALNCDNSVKELMKYRGGDTVGFQAMNQEIYMTGEVSLDALDTLGTQVKSVETLNAYLLGMHYKSTLL